MPTLRVCAYLAVIGGLGACAGCIQRGPSTAGQVFAGPLDLPLHEDINPKSKVSARVHHGDRLEIVQQRRRLYKLRTSKGLEGWTDERNLMSVDQMAALANLEKQAREEPSQGVATCFEVLNVHTEPQRFSPSFVQIKSGDKFDVIAHETAARTELAHRILVKPQPKTDAKNKKHADHKRLAPPPSPDAPKPPSDWLELSEERKAPTPVKPLKPEKEEPKEPVPTDDWTLVRTSGGAAGWVLTNRIYLAIPDEVAQYAEGHRITTYFSLGKIHDDELNVDKDIWLWTTIRAGSHPYDFDSFRVFTWNPKRHRYETAYIQRTMEGYLPVLVKKEGGQETFSICLVDDDGNRARRRFAMVDRQVKGAGSESCGSEPVKAGPAAVAPAPAAPEPKGPETLREKLKDRAAAVKKRLTGK